MPTRLEAPEEFRPFNRWLNELRETELDPVRYRFSFTDLDGVFYRVEPHLQANPFAIFLFLVEVKTHGRRDLRPSQVHAFWPLDAVLAAASGMVIRRMTRGRTTRFRFEYLGLHHLVLSDDRPDTSAWMTWNGNRITYSELIEVLRFDRDPRDPARRFQNDPGFGGVAI